MRWRLFISAALLLCSLSARAQVSVSIERAKSYLKGHDKCEFAVGVTAPDPQEPGKTDESKVLSDYVFCFTDIIQGEGTINEKEGCGLVFLSMNTGKYRSPAPDIWSHQLGWGGSSASPIAEGKKCKDDGFKTVLNMGLGFPNYKTVKAVSSGRFSLVGLYAQKSIVLFSKNGVLQKSYDQAVATLAQEEKIAEAKAEQKRIDQEKAASKEREHAEKEKKKSDLEKLTKIEGSWIGPCKDKDGFSDKQSMNFNSGKFQVFVDLYRSAGCAQSKRYQRITMTGSYKVGAVVNTKDGTKALDLTNQGAKFHVYDKDYAEQVSESSKFGLVTVVPNRDYDITNSKELSSIIGKTTYGIFKLSGMTLNLDKDGSGLDGDPKNRSKLQIDIATTYKRQAEKSSSETEEDQDSNSEEHD